MNKVSIISAVPFEDLAEVVDIFGQGCNYPTAKGVEGYQVDFDVIANNGTEKKKFHIVYQNQERSCNITAYNGFEMMPAKMYGCDEDESEELEAFLDYDEDALNVLEEKAEKLCKEYLQQNYPE